MKQFGVTSADHGAGKRRSVTAKVDLNQFYSVDGEIAWNHRERVIPALTDHLED